MCERKQERQNRKQNGFFFKNGATHMEDRKSEMRETVREQGKSEKVAEGSLTSVS